MLFVKRIAENLPDTNVILRYLIKDNRELYNRADQFFSKIKVGEERAIILECVIVECIYVLIKIYKVPRDEAANSLIAILNYRGIANHDRDDLISALYLFAREKIDIVDCILYVKANNSGSILFSFDNDLNKMARLNK